MMTDGGKGAFATTLTAAIRASGLTLDSIRLELAEHDVRISVATLSYWQNGRSQPAGAHAVRTLTAMEQVLGVPVGSLVNAAPVAQTRSRGSIASRSMLRMPSSVEEAVQMSGMDPRGLRKVSSHFTITLAPDRTQSAEVVRNVVQCLVSGTRSFPVVAEIDAGSNQEVTGLSNCSVGQVWRLPETNLVVTEMVLPRSLRQGELLMLEYMTTLGPIDEPCGLFGVALPRVSELVMEVQFPWQDDPRRVVTYSRAVDAPDLGFDAPDAVELPVTGGSAQVVRLDVPPSVTMMRWEW